ncbi:MAG TPA: hypothetical protein VFE46_11065 [Pirellulales bacterium]|jgi:hypothetical protein|nr:hypothetical protein [Pirellulales bacterium]
MKATLVGAVAGALAVVLGWWMFGRETPVFAEHPSVYDTSTQLIAVPIQVDNVRQQIAVIDPVKRAMCVYHIDLPTGTITLKSARNISGDLQIDDFNGVNPLPRDIRAQLDHR